MSMVSAEGTLVERLQMSKEPRKTSGAKLAVLTLSAKVKESVIQLPK